MQAHGSAARAPPEGRNEAGPRSLVPVHTKGARTDVILHVEGLKKHFTMGGAIDRLFGRTDVVRPWTASASSWTGGRRWEW